MLKRATTVHHTHLGEIASVFTAIFWTITALSFEAAGKRIGSLTLNLLRLIVGFMFLSLFTWFYRGYLFPADATLRTWLILILSGLFGFVLGDLCLFQAFVLIGARISMLIMALAPLFTALISWIIIGEKLTPMNWAGMVVTLSGIAMVVLKKEDHTHPDGRVERKRMALPVWGLVLALGGAIGQAAGLVLSKFGMRGYDPFASAQIRVLTGIVGFSILFTILRHWGEAAKALTQRKPMIQLSVGAFFGPFLGVSFSLLAVQNTSAGIAATIMAIVPVLIIPPSVLLFKEKVTTREVVGAILAVGGVAIFFL
jgi:drug/metabolite transporter (DMT)-like permease